MTENIHIFSIKVFLVKRLCRLVGYKIYKVHKMKLSHSLDTHPQPYTTILDYCVCAYMCVCACVHVCMCAYMTLYRSLTVTQGSRKHAV